MHKMACLQISVENISLAELGTARKTFRHEIFSWIKIFFEKKYFVCFQGISQLKECFSKL